MGACCLSISLPLACRKLVIQQTRLLIICGSTYLCYFSFFPFFPRVTKFIWSRLTAYQVSFTSHLYKGQFFGEQVSELLLLSLNLFWLSQNLISLMSHHDPFWNHYPYNVDNLCTTDSFDSLRTTFVTLLVLVKRISVYSRFGCISIWPQLPAVFKGKWKRPCCSLSKRSK